VALRRKRARPTEATDRTSLPPQGAGLGTDVINVPVVSLDDFIGAGVPLPQLVKIDVEGGEYEVLRGGKKLFGRQRPLVIAEVHHQQAAEQIASWLSECQYYAQWNIPKEQFPRHLFAWPKETDGAAWMRDSLSR
jgi:hypothetical protein